jgi:hypothetical protein
MDAIISAPMGAKWERRGAQDRAQVVINGHGLPISNRWLLGADYSECAETG